MCVPKYMYLYHVPAGALGRKKTESDLLELEMLAVVSCIVDAGNWIWVFCKVNKYSPPLSCLSSPILQILNGSFLFFMSEVCVFFSVVVILIGGLYNLSIFIISKKFSASLIYSQISIYLFNNYFRFNSLFFFQYFKEKTGIIDLRLPSF